MNQLNKVMWGLIFILLGVILGTNALGLTNIEIFFNGWWTLFIIIPNFIGLFKNKGDLTGNIIGLLIGSILLLSVRDIINFEIIGILIIPSIFIIIGLSIIFNNIVRSKITEKFKTTSKDGLETIAATFAEQKVDKDNEKFCGANLDAVFGSIVLDLTKADIDKEAFIKTSSIFAGIKIIVPNDINIKIKSTPIFGGITNKIPNKTTNKKTLYIESFCLFGGLDIKWAVYKKVLK